MNRVIIYTNKLGFTPKNLREVIRFAEENKRFRIAEVGLNAHLQDVQVGDNIITGKGGNLYVLKTFDKSVDELTGADREYVDNLVRNYDLQKSNITSVAHRIKFATWCKEVRPLLSDDCSTKKSNKTEMKNSFKNFGERLKAQFCFDKADDVRIAMDGNICVETPEGYVAIDNNYRLISYPCEAVLDVPAYTIAKPFDQIKEGDVILRAKSYAKVKSIKDGKISVVGYTGNGSNVYPIKDFLLGQAYVRVVVSFTGMVDGQINPMMLYALSKDEKSNSLLPLMLMNQNGSALTQNPMMLALFAGDGDIDFKDIMMYSMLGGGQNPFANLFAPQPVQLPTNPPVNENAD